MYVYMYIYICCQLRMKINNCVRKPGNAVPDEDAPDDPESTRYWCFLKKTHKTRERTSQELTTRINVAPDAGMAEALLASPSGSLGSAASAAEVASAGRKAEAALAVYHDIKSTAGSYSVDDKHLCASLHQVRLGYGSSLPELRQVR